MTKKECHYFRDRIYSEYRKGSRTFPWRSTEDPYRILISEVMLQQTQAGSRTVEKYHVFLEYFPNIVCLAKASLKDVLTIWQGLGYNRRAKALRDTARILVKEYGGVIPNDAEALIKLPGIGPYTASAICAFAFNQPTVFIETNIRSVYIHFFFFRRRREIDDREIMPLIEETLDRKNPRRWYAALMDYGATLKRHAGNPNRRSKHYSRQSVFEGSDRQIRGLILRELSRGALTFRAISQKTAFESTRVHKQLSALSREGLIFKKGRLFTLAT